MFKEMCLHLIVLLVLISQRCLILADEPAVNSAGLLTANRYSTHLQSESVAVPVAANQQQNLQEQPQNLNHHTQQQAQTISVYHKVSSSSSNNNVPTQGGPHSIYHAAPGSGHMEKRNSYNLLSEAMSQAVSNEFSALGSGSADGACQADDLDCYSGNVQDRLGMEAIRTLHRQLDDDDNGNIDLSESDDFLREELKYDSGYEKRQKVFHFNDDMHISVKELWEAWLRSEVHNWTIEQTTDWLAQSVQLPQYVELFKQHKVTGATLPRLAVNNMHYVSNVLGIKDPIHKQKISLKAMDVVLFGPPRETGTRWKDYILVTLLLSAIIGCWYAYQQNKNAKRHLRRMAQDMEGLQRAEQSLLEMQKELERARMEQENVATEKMDLERRLKEAPSLSSSSSDLEVQQLKKEIEILRTELSRAEIELVDNCWAPPPQLQSWLQYTYELESKNHMKKRISAEKQLQSAREACEKLRKKRSSLVGAFVSTHGKSIDDVDRSIVEARNALGEVTHELQERLHRWKQIETCLGINIVNNNGLPYLESVLYGRNGGTIKGSRGRITSSSTDDLDDESVQGMLDTYSRSSAGLGGGSSSIINSSSNNIRDDSSCSDDGAETQSVQFYLSTAPTTPSITNTLPANIAGQRATLPLEAINHIGNNINSSISTIPSTPLAIQPLSSALPPPPALPSHNNAQTNFTFSDSIGDDNRHSPSASSEHSVTVPPRTKKHNYPSSVPPPPSGPIGRVPLPPPRKSTPSQMLRSQSTDLVPTEIYTTYFSRQQQQQQAHTSKSSGISGQQPFNTIIATGNSRTTSGSNNNKKMVKQHSSASQQSTSSTSSSVQSAPPAVEYINATQGYNPITDKWSPQERIYEHQHMLQQYAHHRKQQPQLSEVEESFLSSKIPATKTSFISATNSTTDQAGKSSNLQFSSKTKCCVASSTTTLATTGTSTHSDTQMDNSLQYAAESTSLDGSIKKRKRRLRFTFSGIKKSYSQSGSTKNKST
ncbi:stromal interaction molecule homolog isoform X2 [Teleopsis dalmanni]|uniref:stromal interaction molecule homolog isoform X2 n=1 Tax=Teleopsis dalmanni TaxID=139649 RepID=UPI0018CCBF08|nr:stromal interaction molecule homolog isoform X2 [Teleopsis dalmanni]